MNKELVYTGMGFFILEAAVFLIAGLFWAISKIDFPTITIEMLALIALVIVNVGFGSFVIAGLKLED